MSSVANQLGLRIIELTEAGDTAVCINEALPDNGKYMTRQAIPVEHQHGLAKFQWIAERDATPEELKAAHAQFEVLVNKR